MTRTSRLTRMRSGPVTGRRHDSIMPVFCPTGQRDRGHECRRGAARKSLADQGAFYCAWGCFSTFCFGRQCTGALPLPAGGRAIAYDFWQRPTARLVLRDDRFQRSPQDEAKRHLAGRNCCRTLRPHPEGPPKAGVSKDGRRRARRRVSSYAIALPRRRERERIAFIATPPPEPPRRPSRQNGVAGTGRGPNACCRL